jgi:hypothetical protein
MRFYLPVILAVFGNILYHSAQRLTPQAANPFLSVGLSFSTAAVLCFILYKATAAGPLAGDLAVLSWTTVGLGVAVVLIETSFLVAYRWGWPIGSTALTVTALQTALLLPIGCFFLAERLTAAGWVGVLLCLVGLGLVAVQGRA